MKQKLLFILAIAIVVGWFAIDSNAIKGYIVESIESKAADGGIFLKLAEPDLGFGSITSQKATILFRAVPISLELDSLHIGCRPALLSFSLNCAVNFAAYQGQVQMNLIASTKGISVSEGRIDGVKIDLHPQLNALGFKAGLLSANINELSRESLKASISAHDISKPEQTILPSWMVGMPFDIPIPSFIVNSLKVEIVKSEKLLDLSSVLLESTLANSTSKNLQMKLGSKPLAISGELEVTPTEQGTKSLPLPFFCPPEKVSPGRTVVLKFSGRPTPTC